LFWKGLPADPRRLHGVGLGICTSLLNHLLEDSVPISETLMTLRIPLAKCRYITIIGVYAPTVLNDETTKDEFYKAL